MYNQNRFMLSRHLSRDSWLHRLDPVTRALVFLLAIVAIFSVKGWLGLCLVGGYMFLLCSSSGAGIVFYVRGLGNFTWMFAMTFAINLIFPRYGGQAFGYAALIVASRFTLRLALMVLAAMLLSVMMPPSEIGNIVLIFGKVGGRIGRAATDFATLLTIAIRFIPVLAEEAARIRTAQILRGRRIGGLGSRIRFITDLIIPLVDAALRRSTNLGFALEARCYGWHQSRHAGIRFRLADVLALILSAGVVVSVLIERSI